MASPHVDELVQVEEDVGQVDERSRSQHLERQRALGLDLLKTQSLVDLTHVLFNLNEFVYIR